MPPHAEPSDTSGLIEATRAYFAAHPVPAPDRPPPYRSGSLHIEPIYRPITREEAAAILRKVIAAVGIRLPSGPRISPGVVETTRRLLRMTRFGLLHPARLTLAKAWGIARSTVERHIGILREFGVLDWLCRTRFAHDDALDRWHAAQDSNSYYWVVPGQEHVRPVVKFRSAKEVARIIRERGYDEHPQDVQRPDLDRCGPENEAQSLGYQGNLKHTDKQRAPTPEMVPVAQGDRLTGEARTDDQAMQAPAPPAPPPPSRPGGAGRAFGDSHDADDPRPVPPPPPPPETQPGSATWAQWQHARRLFLTADAQRRKRHSEYHVQIADTVTRPTALERITAVLHRVQND